MEELLQLLSDRLGVPPDLLERAAAARAAASGAGVDDLVRSWAGEGAPPVAAAAAPEAAPAPAPAPEPAAPPAEPAAATAPAPPEPAVAEPRVEVLAPAEPPETAAAEGDDAEPPVEEEKPAVLGGFPRWLAASFVLLPLVAFVYALLTPDAPDCGSAGQLAVDPVTGVAVNCDGSPYGVEAADFFSMGQEVYAGKCAACHGVGGGGGVGPAFTGGAVLATFPTCDSHIEWVTLGSAGWPDPVYGATATPVSGGMPGFAEPALTAEELAAVVLYERVAFGGEVLADAEGGCGLTGGEAVAAP